MGKLSGITVVDLSQFLPGPMLSVMMADHGARVIKIEPAAGDPTRTQAPYRTASRCGSPTSIAARKASSSI